MSVRSRVVTVTTSATRLDLAEGGQSSEGGTFYNGGAVTVYLGGSDVTANTAAATGGYPLAAGQHIAIDLAQQDELYGRTAASSAAVNCLEAVAT